MNTSLLLSAIGLAYVVAIAAIGLVIRVTVKWTRLEDRLGAIAENLTKLVADKDRVHQAILEAMQRDREATNERLRYLERRAMETADRAPAHPPIGGASWPSSPAWRTT